MQQYVVPQFIDVEGKIIGPITTRQFVLMLGGGLALFLGFRFLSLGGFIGVAVLVFVLVVVFGFIKVNGRPFHLFLINLLQTVFQRPMLKVWLREARAIPWEKKGAVKKGIIAQPISAPQDKMSTSRTRLSELSLIVDTGGAYDENEEESYAP